jgi:hypothetical protein
MIDKSNFHFEFILKTNPFTHSSVFSYNLGMNPCCRPWSFTPVSGAETNPSYLCFVLSCVQQGVFFIPIAL